MITLFRLDFLSSLQPLLRRERNRKLGLVMMVIFSKFKHFNAFSSTCGG